MPGLQTPARDLTDKELEFMTRCASAVIVGAAYLLYDMAIAEALEHSIRFPEQGDSNAIRRLYTRRQVELPRIDAPISHSWVVWTASTWDNWQWLLSKYISLQYRYVCKFGRDHAEYLEIRRLINQCPRPRAHGRTPFPEEAC